MTYRQIKESRKNMLVPTDISDILDCTPYSINVQAQSDATKLGFPVCVMGTRVRIPRLAFLHWLEFGNAPVVINDIKVGEVEAI